MSFGHRVQFLRDTRMKTTTRLPGAGRSKAVRIRKQDAVDVVASSTDEWAWLDDVVGKTSDDFLADGRQQPAQQVRPELDKLFY